MENAPNIFPIFSVGYGTSYLYLAHMLVTSSLWWYAAVIFSYDIILLLVTIIVPKYHWYADGLLLRRDRGL